MNTSDFQEINVTPKQRMTIHEILEECRVVTKDEPYNFVSMKGGKFNIPKERKKEFLEVWSNDFLKLTPHNAPNLVPKLPKTKKIPFFMDIDLKYNKEQELPFDDCRKLFAWLSMYIENKFTTKDQGLFRDVVSSHLETWDMFSLGSYFIVQKKTGYWSTHANYGNVYKAGCHAYFPHFHCDVEEAKEVRNEAIQFIKDHKLFKDELSTVEEIVDDCIVHRKRTGLVMVGDFKKGGCGGRYDVVLLRSFQKTTLVDRETWSNDDYIYMYRLIVERMYDFVWKEPDIKQEFTPIYLETPDNLPVAKEPSLNIKSLPFDLMAFLQNTSKPSHTQFTQLMSFFANTDVAPEEIRNACQPFWNKSNPYEYAITLDNFRGKAGCSIGTVIHIFNELKTNDSSYNKVFPTDESDTALPVVTYYDDYKTLLGQKTHLRADVKRLLKKMIVYIYDIKMFAYWLKRKELTKSGGEVFHEHLTVTKDIPFGGNDDFYVTCYPSLDVMMKEIMKLSAKLKPDNPNEMELLKKLTDARQNCQTEAQLYDAIGADINLPLDNVSVGKTVKKLQMNHELKRYQTMEFKPYCGIKSSCHPNTLGTFRPCYLEFEKTSRVNVQHTRIWEYFRDVFAWGKTDEMFHYILNVVSMQVQHPEIRSERLWQIVSEEEGTGKSFFYQILCALLGTSKVAFHDSLDTYDTRFNWNCNSKLVHFIDDISSASETKTRRLFPKVTCKTQNYEKKGQTILTLKEYSNVFLTANDVNGCLHMKHTDRRQVILRVSNLKHRDMDFFKALSEELADITIVKAWYDFFKERKLNGFCYHKDPPTSFKQDAMTSKMPKSLMFIRDFFIDNNWIYRYMPEYGLTTNWHNAYLIKGMGKKSVIRIKRDRLYKLYREHLKQFYPSSKVRNCDTFESEIEKIGAILHQKRQRIRSKTCTVIDLPFQPMGVKFNEMFNVVLNWECTEKKPEFKESHL